MLWYWSPADKAYWLGGEDVSANLQALFIAFGLRLFQCLVHGSTRKSVFNSFNNHRDMPPHNFAALTCCQFIIQIMTPRNQCSKL